MSLAMKHLNTTAPAPDPAAPHNACHRQAVASAQATALWAALAGLELMPHKLSLPHGVWIPWVEANCEYSRRTASSYLGAAERAMAQLGDASIGSPSTMDAAHCEQLKGRITEMLENDHLSEQRAALIAAIRPATQKQLPARKTKPRSPRPPGPRPLFTPQAMPRVLERWQVTPPAAQHAFLDSIRDQALAYLVP